MLFVKKLILSAFLCLTFFCFVIAHRCTEKHYAFYPFSEQTNMLLKTVS